MLKQGQICRKCNKNAYFEVFSGDFMYTYAMLYAKMFHGYDKMKHFETLQLAVKMLGIGSDACDYHAVERPGTRLRFGRKSICFHPNVG